MLILLSAAAIAAGWVWLDFSTPEKIENQIDLYLLEGMPKPTFLNVQYANRKRCDPLLTSLDLYLPDSTGPNPAVIYIHGGAWQWGDKIPVFNPAGLKRADIALVSINYRQSPAFKHPAHIEDVAAAIAFIRDNAEKYHIDPKKLFLLGHSAGAHLAALAATDRRRLAAHGMALSDLAGVILLDGSAYNIPLLIKEYPDNAKGKCLRSIGTQPAILEDASPITHVHDTIPLPPFLIVHAGSDPITARQASVFAETLRRAGAEVIVHHDLEKNHASVWYMLAKDDDPLTVRVMEFIRNCLGKPAASSRPASAPR